MTTTTSGSTSPGRRSSSFSSSPEFEFWMLRNPSCPQPDLLSADQLFSHGILLPLHPLLSPPADDPPDSDPITPTTTATPEQYRNGTDPVPESEPGPQISAPSPPELSSSKRWRDIFRKNEKKPAEDKEKEKKKERGSSNKSGSGPHSPELNINLWPFSRSRSAGTATGKPRMGSGGGASVTRKVSSAPCSRSNSAGESKSRKWPSSPGRPGVHLGRSSPVWQVRRGGAAGGRSSDPSLIRNPTSIKGVKKDASVDTRRSNPHKPVAAASAASAAAGGGNGGAKARVLNLNVPMCIGYRQHMGCRSDVGGALRAGDGGEISGGGASGGGGRGSNFLRLRGLFAKKVY